MFNAPSHPFNTPQNQATFDRYYLKVSAWADRVFAGVFIFQWVLGIALALWIAPTTWIGTHHQISVHVYSAIFLGAFLAAYPVYLALVKPGQASNRIVVAAAQMMFSILFIHLTGGRIETHFHIFVSLAFLSLYRDWRPIAVATAITFGDHIVRGFFWPESVYGILSSNFFRAFEHAAWVLFEDAILLLSIRIARRELFMIARKENELENTIASIEQKVDERTRELKVSQQIVVSQSQALAASAKMSALGEMAGSIAHEINTPLALISLLSGQLADTAVEENFDKNDVVATSTKIENTVQRIAKVISGLRTFARDGQGDAYEDESVQKIVDETLVLCAERLKQNKVKLIVDPIDPKIIVECRWVQISQVLLNLLVNASDAITALDEKWIHISVQERNENIEISIVDSGSGIPVAARDKIFQPFFTTKQIGKGTGLGLSISKGLIESHGGKLFIQSESRHTHFVVQLPKPEMPGFQKRA